MRKFTAIWAAMLCVTFAFSQTKVEMKPSELSKGLSDYISKYFSGYSVDRAFKVDSKGEKSTEVIVSKGSERLALTFDKDTRLTKKEAIKPDTKNSTVKEEKKPLPAAKEPKTAVPVKK
jgi:hypothetical protein